MERVLGWCLFIYSVGAFAVWLLVGEFSHDWHTAVVMGSTVALLSLGVALLTVLFNGDVVEAFPETLALSSIPIGFLAQTNHGGSFKVLFWTVFGILSAALVVWCLKRLSQRAERKRRYW